MTQEQKDLLLKDLCSRLPHNPKVKYVHYHKNGDDENIVLNVYNAHKLLVGMDIYHIKPYLRPMSSMTEEEIKEYIKLLHEDCIDVEKPTHCCKNSITAIVVTLTSRESIRYWYNDMVSIDTIDFLNSHHFDWRGLVPLELALEAPGVFFVTLAILADIVGFINLWQKIW